MNLPCDGHAFVCPRVFSFLLDWNRISRLRATGGTTSVYFSLSNLFYFTLVSMADEGVASLLAFPMY